MKRFIHPETMQALAMRYNKLRQTEPDIDSEVLKQWAYKFMYIDDLIDTLELKIKWGLRV